MSNFQPIRLLDPVCWYKFTYLMANSADPDQLASSEANWSGSTLFVKTGYIRLSRTRVKFKGKWYISDFFKSSENDTYLNYLKKKSLIFPYFLRTKGHAVKWKTVLLTLIMPNKLRCHAHFYRNCQSIRLLNPDCWYKFTYWMTNSADPDQLASSLFAKAGHIRFQRDKG